MGDPTDKDNEAVIIKKRFSVCLIKYPVQRNYTIPKYRNRI